MIVCGLPYDAEAVSQRRMIVEQAEFYLSLTCRS